LKTTEDRTPILLQRRRAQNTAFVWAISLDGSPVALKVSNVSNAAGQSLPAAEAASVQVSNASQHWSLLVNPHRNSVTISDAGNKSWHTNAPFAAR
jgi:hypothetical protein